MSGITIVQDGPLTIVTIDRPGARNALDPASGIRLREAFEAFEADREARIAILTGAGGVFCAGADLKAVAAGQANFDAEGPGYMGPTRMTLSKPVIAAVEGPAVAGGLELALWADLRVASRSAIFGVYCRRWGVPLIDGGTIRLPRLIGQSRALDLILTGRPVDAEEAFAIGLANRLVPVGRALPVALELARQIARFPQDCMRIDRMSAHRQWSLPLDQALLAEARAANGAILALAEEGAARFASGLGRGGDFGEV